MKKHINEKVETCYVIESDSTSNYVGEVQELADSLGLGTPKYTFKKEFEGPFTIWMVKLSIKGMEEVEAIGTSKKEAKRLAAIMMIANLHMLMIQRIEEIKELLSRI